MIDYRIVPVTPFQQNCSIVWCEATRKAAVVDPGGDVERILATVEELGVTIEKVWLTHGHIDHVGGVVELAARLAVPVEGPQREDEFWLQGLPQQSRMFGFPPIAAFAPDRWLAEGDEMALGEARFQVIHAPGHTPGHVVFYQPQARLAWVGDVLFAGSIGRTDFPKGDHAALIASIRDKLFPLGEDVVFVPGHGPVSTLGREQVDNPYVGKHALGR